MLVSKACEESGKAGSHACRVEEDLGRNGNSLPRAGASAYDATAKESAVRTPELLMQQAKEERRRGAISAAEATYAEAASAAETSHLRAHALRHVAELAAEQGAGERALAAAEEAVRIYAADAQTHRLNLANARRVRALAFAALGRTAQSADDWRAARELYDELGIEAGVAECDRGLSSA